MEIRVIIADDDKTNSETLKEIVERFNNYSMYKNVGVIYKVLAVFEGIHAFSEARSFLECGNSDFDIFLADYHLKRGLGTDLFKLVNKEFKVYNILHSETDHSFVLAKKEIRENLVLVHDEVYTKDQSSIHEALRRFESYILSVRLFGHSLFRSKYFADYQYGITTPSGGDLFYKTLNVRNVDILYISSLGNDEYHVFYRLQTTREITDFKAKKIQVGELIRSDLIFRKVNSKLIVNMLWVAHIDLFSQSIAFTTITGKLHYIHYIDTGLFTIQIFPLVNQINRGISSFFRK
ncbi:MAG: hypothetical protein HEQ40_12250 [Lacibacter sp.]|jgi:CheY-like chemotaxis protein